jgi:hypothetical protein
MDLALNLTSPSDSTRWTEWTSRVLQWFCDLMLRIELSTGIHWLPQRVPCVEWIRIELSAGSIGYRKWFCALSGFCTRLKVSQLAGAFV